MTNLEKAHNLIENGEIPDFFTFLRSNAKPNEMLTRLEDTFILGKADVDFYKQCKALANKLLSENNTQQSKQETKTENTRVINAQNYFEKLDNSGTINFDQRKTD